jgi:hypothetical protein
MLEDEAGISSELNEINLKEDMELVMEELLKNSVTNFYFCYSYSNSALTFLTKFSIVIGFFMKQPILRDGYCSFNAS